MPVLPLIPLFLAKIFQFLSRSHIAVFLHIENLLGLKRYSPVCLDICGTQRMVENTVSFLFTGFDLPSKTRMLKTFVIFRIYILLKLYIILLRSWGQFFQKVHYSVTVNLTEKKLKQKEN